MAKTAAQRETEQAVHLRISPRVNITAEGYPQALLDICKDLLSGGQYGLSAVVAQAACEVAVERALSAAFASKGIQYLEDTLCGALEGFSLANNRNRKLYTALTGDHIEKQPFWEAYKKAVVQRNSIMHHGLGIGKSEAENSYDTAVAFTTHLKQHSIWEQDDHLSD